MSVATLQYLILFYSAGENTKLLKLTHKRRKLVETILVRLRQIADYVPQSSCKDSLR